ncbi:hypothetical protein [Flavobacterium sp.]|uniref:hypothetical protein n=1 Tax=Flavobacterium sp. TaxID=239 RepID=UPI003D6B9ACD
MENTLENKAKFFSLYYGQNIRSWNEDDQGRVAKVGPTYMTKRIISECHLKLDNPEFGITAEDKKFLEKSMIGFVFGIELVGHFAYLEVKSSLWKGKKLVSLNAVQLDYLRSKGFALPWMELSVEKLIEYGWIKLYY